jgi:2-dehydropantoate 2-reductase
MSLRIAIVGAGAIGGYLAVKLSLAGNDVTCIARGENLQAIQNHGMKLIQEDGTELVGTVQACSIDKAQTYDYVFLTLKSHQVAAVAKDIDCLCHATTSVVTMQNGLPWWYFHQLAGAYQGTQLKTLDPEGKLWSTSSPNASLAQWSTLQQSWWHPAW